MTTQTTTRLRATGLAQLGCTPAEALEAIDEIDAMARSMHATVTDERSLRAFCQWSRDAREVLAFIVAGVDGGAA